MIGVFGIGRIGDLVATNRVPGRDRLSNWKVWFDLALSLTACLSGFLFGRRLILGGVFALVNLLFLPPVQVLV